MIPVFRSRIISIHDIDGIALTHFLIIVRLQKNWRSVDQNYNYRHWQHQLIYGVFNVPD